MAPLRDAIAISEVANDGGSSMIDLSSQSFCSLPLLGRVYLNTAMFPCDVSAYKKLCFVLKVSIAIESSS